MGNSRGGLVCGNFSWSHCSRLDISNLAKKKRVNGELQRRVLVFFVVILDFLLRLFCNGRPNFLLHGWVEHKAPTLEPNGRPLPIVEKIAFLESSHHKSSIGRAKTAPDKVGHGWGCKLAVPSKSRKKRGWTACSGASGASRIDLGRLRVEPLPPSVAAFAQNPFVSFTFCRHPVRPVRFDQIK
jgi:hypothetical protein